MNILFFTHYSDMYGANRSLLDLISVLQTKSINCLLVLPEEGTFSKILEQNGIAFIIHPFHWWAEKNDSHNKSRLKNWMHKISIWKLNREKHRYNLNQLKVIKNKIGDFNPDFIHSNSSVFNFGLLYAKRHNIAHIWHLRENLGHYDLEWNYDLNYVTRNFKSSEILISISYFLKQYFSEWINTKDTHILYNGVISKMELQGLDERRKYRVINNDDSIVFGIVGLIHPGKGQEEAIKAFSIVNSRYPKTKLLIVGGGNPRSLKRLVNQAGLTRKVEFCGQVENPFEYFLKMDVSLMCSRNEGLGRVTLESMATAIPVIGFKDGGTTELIQDNYNGLFYEKGYEDLADRMLYMIESKEHRLKMGDNGRFFFEDKFTSEIYAQNYLKILKNYNH